MFQYYGNSCQQPRIYPKPFAERVAGLVPRLIEDDEHALPLPPASAKAKDIFAEMPEGDWCDDCSLLSPIIYVRGSTRLHIPPEWRKSWPGVL